MVFKLVETIIIATVAFQFIPGSWEGDLQVLEVMPRESIVGAIEWPSVLPNAGDVAMSNLPEAEERPAPKKNNSESYGVKTTSSNAIVVDLVTGKILFEKNITEQRPVASITKLMTALVFLENNPGWDEEHIIRNTLTVGNNNFYEGEAVSHDDLFCSALVGSDNTAARNLAYAAGMTLDEFVVKMNEKSAEMGLTAVFVDPVGLDADNRASVMDVAKILRAALGHDEVRNCTQKKFYEFTSASGKYHYIKSTNDLLKSFINKEPYSILAGKTGSLIAAGYCLAIAVEHEGHSILVASLNSESDYSRFQDVKSMVYWVFENYEWPEL